MAGDPFQRIAGQAFIGPALPDITPHPVVAGCALGILDLARRKAQLVPGFRHVELVFAQQILAVEQQPGVGKPWHRDQPPADCVVRDEALEVLLFGPAGVAAQVKQVVAQQPRPDHIDLQHVDPVRSCRQQLLVQRKALARIVGGCDDLHRVAGLVRPGGCRGLAKCQFLADAGAGQPDFGRIDRARQTGRRDPGAKEQEWSNVVHRMSPVWFGHPRRRHAAGGWRHPQSAGIAMRCVAWQDRSCACRMHKVYHISFVGGFRDREHCNSYRPGRGVACLGPGEVHTGGDRPVRQLATGAMAVRSGASEIPGQHEARSGTGTRARPG